MAHHHFITVALKRTGTQAPQVLAVRRSYSYLGGTTVSGRSNHAAHLVTGTIEVQAPTNI